MQIACDTVLVLDPAARCAGQTNTFAGSSTTRLFSCGVPSTAAACLQGEGRDAINCRQAGERRRLLPVSNPTAPAAVASAPASVFTKGAMQW